MVRLRTLGWGRRRIAAELGCNRETVQRYLVAGGWMPYCAPERPGALAGRGAWLAERFRRHRGNADVVRQELAAELGIAVSLRTVERACAPLRRELAAEALATVRFETPLGRQVHIDPRIKSEGRPRRARGGDRRGASAGASVRRHAGLLAPGLCAGVSARAAVVLVRGDRGRVPLLRRAARGGAARQRPRAGRAPRRGHAGGGVQRSLPRLRALLGGAAGRLRALPRPDQGQEPALGLDPRDERGVGYVKGNASAGRSFANWAALEAHLAWWMREVADVRGHGTTGEAPVARFEREEAVALRPLGGRPPFRPLRELTRRVQNDGCVDVDTNHYSVPWTLIGASVSVVVSGDEVQVLHAGAEVARHGQRRGRRERAVAAAHLRGIVAGDTGALRAEGAILAVLPSADLLRPLAEYEQVVGGRWWEAGGERRRGGVPAGDAGGG